MLSDFSDLFNQSEEFDLPSYTTGCFCLFKSREESVEDVRNVKIYSGFGLSKRIDSIRGKGKLAARAMASKAVLHQIDRFASDQESRSDEDLFCVSSKLFDSWLPRENIYFFNNDFLQALIHVLETETDIGWVPHQIGIQ